MRRTGILLACLLTHALAFGEAAVGRQVPRPLQDNFALYVCSNTGMKLVKFDSQTGAWVADLSGADEPVDVEVGPNDFVFVTDEGPGAANVRRFDPATGQADADAYGETTVLGGPKGLAFGPDGHLFVADMLFEGTEVVEFDETGKQVRVLPDDPVSPVLLSIEDIDCDTSGNIYVVQWLFAGDETPGVFKFTGDGWTLFGQTGNLISAWGMAFGPDGDLYVVDDDTTHFGVHRYDGKTGASKGVFGQTGATQNLSRPRYCTFSPDGDLYVTEEQDGSVRVFNGPLKPNPGAARGIFGETAGKVPDPLGLVFGPGGAPPQKPTLAIEKLQSGNMMLNLTGTQGKSYELRYNTDATVSDFTQWIIGGTITLEGSTTGTWEDTTAAADPWRVYKAKEQ